MSLVREVVGAHSPARSKRSNEIRQSGHPGEISFQDHLLGVVEQVGPRLVLSISIANLASDVLQALSAVREFCR